jgi:hypothetical protein
MRIRQYPLDLLLAALSTRLNPVTPHIGQIIFNVIINPLFIRRERIFSATGPAAQSNRLSGSLYPQWCLALVALEKMMVHNHKSLN